MNTFLGCLGDALPASGTRLSVLSMDLPLAITPELAGLTVGAFVGVVGFIAVLLLVGRGSRQPHRQHHQERSAAQVVVTPYGTMQRDTPPAEFQVRSVPPSSMLHPFRPSTDLSARVFAKMRFGVDPSMTAMTAAPAAPVVAPVSVSSIIVVQKTGPVSALKSRPHPLGIIPTGSSAMQAARPASFADLDLDDGATELGEPPDNQARTSVRRHHP